MKRYIRASSTPKVEIGDRIRYEAKFNYETNQPEYAEATVVSISGGLAGHGDTRPDRILKLQKDDGRRFNLDEHNVLEIL